MISKVKTIENVGKYEAFNGTSIFEKNTIIFGFNGAGKSTLSDIFYSLSLENREDLILKRKTLNRPGEKAEDKNISIILTNDEDEAIEFKDDKWINNVLNINVFNNHYINDHVFVSRHLEGNAIPIGMGKDGTKFMKQREELIEENAEIIKKINDIIVNLSENGFKIKDFSKNKVTNKTKDNRYKSMASFELYSLSQKTIIEDKIKSNIKYIREVEEIDKCKKLYDEIKGIELIDRNKILKSVKRNIRIQSKEIAQYLSESLTVADIKWAVTGYKNQKNENVCPMCGQTICEKRAMSLFTKLGKYVSQNKDENIRVYCAELNLIVSQLKIIDLNKRIAIFNEIIALLDRCNLLLKKDKDRMKNGLAWGENENTLLNKIIGKIEMKAENPYLEITFSSDEQKCIIQINKVLKNILLLNQIISDADERLKNKIDKKLSMDDMHTLFNLSYGAYRTSAEELKTYANRILKNKEKISELNDKIDDCYNQIHLDKINGYLGNLNTHIKLEVQNGKYYIKLKDFEAKEYEKGKEIYSEGEERAIAFSYFLAELSKPENINEDNVIIIDDPICSMDVNRKSIISYQIVEMMKNPKWQVIVMTHDIGFVEKIDNFLPRNITSLKLELRAEKNDFIPLNIKDYLTDDEEVYRELICDAEIEGDIVTKIIALMSMRPYSYVKKVAEDDYNVIETKSTYFAHTIYSRNRSIKFDNQDYMGDNLKEYVELINSLTGININSDKIIENFEFEGFDFNSISEMYSNIQLDSMKNARKKVLLMRPLIEACFFQLSLKERFDPLNIGKMYSQTIKSNKKDDEKYSICIKLREVYESSKKYHHGAEDGSLLGISWINPNEIEYYDEILKDAISYIKRSGEIKMMSA